MTTNLIQKNMLTTKQEQHKQSSGNTLLEGEGDRMHTEKNNEWMLVDTIHGTYSLTSHPKDKNNYCKSVLVRRTSAPTGTPTHTLLIRSHRHDRALSKCS